MNLLHQLFSHICGQQHCWVLGGQALPFCQRCTGLYVGAFLALIVIFICRLRPNRFLYWLHGLFMLLMIPFGFHLVSQGGLGRTLTGALFGFGLAYYLVLNPFTAWQCWKSSESEKIASYLLLMGFLLSLILLSVYAGGWVSAFGVTFLGVFGFLGLCFFTAVNLILLPQCLRSLRTNGTP
jgi:uncharacterized membrane protein